jgi:hypothetical protein
MAVAFPVNLAGLGNSLAIWLGISPWQLFFFVFLPPLLLDAAVRIDWFMFRKVRVVQAGRQQQQHLQLQQRKDAAQSLEEMQWQQQQQRCN